MKSRFPLAPLLAVCCCANASAANVTITFDELTHTSGELYIALYDSASAMQQKQAMQSLIIRVYKAQQTTILADLPAGEYGVMVFQDLDNNHNLNTNLMGIPTEPYGFSTNPYLMGPPQFSDIAFTVAETDVSLTINME